MSTSVRLEDRLVEMAQVEGILQHRSAPKQIEYWAEIGRRIAAAVGADEALALSQGLARIRVEPVETAPVPTHKVLDRLERLRASGALPQQVSTARVVYQRHPQHPDYLEAVYTDGRRASGRLIEGRFVPQPIKRDD